MSLKKLALAGLICLTTATAADARRGFRIRLPFLGGSTRSEPAPETGRSGWAHVPVPRGRSGETLVYIGPTKRTSLSDGPLALCRLDERTTLLGLFPIWSSAKQYVLAADECKTERYISIEPAALAQMRADGMIEVDFPPEPQIGVEEKVTNGLAVGVIACLLGLMAYAPIRRRRAMNHMRRPSAPPAMAAGLSDPSRPYFTQRQATPAAQPTYRPSRDPASDSFSAFAALLGSAVNVAGAGDSERLSLLASICSKVQHRPVSLREALDISARAPANPTEATLSGLARQLDRNQKELALTGAAMLVADGERIGARARDYLDQLGRALGLSASRTNALIAEAL